MERFQEKTSCLIHELVFWEDIVEENKKMGIETKIRMLERGGEMCRTDASS